MVNNLDLKQVKAKAKDLAERMANKPLPNPDDVDIKQETMEANLSRITKLLAPEGVDRRRDKGINEALDEAFKVAQFFGWYEEAQELEALRRRKDAIPIRSMSPEFKQKIDDLRASGLPEYIKIKKELKIAIPYNWTKDGMKFKRAFENIVLYPDPYNMKYRNAIREAKEALDSLAASPELQNNPVLLDNISSFRKKIEDLGELPDIPRPKFEDGFSQLDAPFAALAGFNINEIKNGAGDWQFDRTLGGGINDVHLFKNKVTGQYVIVKKDDDYARRVGTFEQKGVFSEEIVAQLYRDLGFAVPAARVLNLGDPDPNKGGLVLLEFAGDGFFGLQDIGVAAERYQAQKSIDAIIPEHQAEILNFVVANGIIGNTDRHKNNYMYGQDPNTGKWRLVPIDNGLAMFNGDFGKANEKMPNALYLKPDDVIRGGHGNANGARALAQEYIDKIGRDAARDQVKEFAERMRLRAEILKFIDPRANEYLSKRAQWVLDNLDEYLDAIGQRGMRF